MRSRILTASSRLQFWLRTQCRPSAARCGRGSRACAPSWTGSRPWCRQSATTGTDEYGGPVQWARRHADTSSRPGGTTAAGVQVQRPVAQRRAAALLLRGHDHLSGDAALRDPERDGGGAGQYARARRLARCRQVQELTLGRAWQPIPRAKVRADVTTEFHFDIEEFLFALCNLCSELVRSARRRRPKRAWTLTFRAMPFAAPVL